MAIQAERYPVLMIFWREDQVVRYELARIGVEARIPRAQVHLIDRCGHIPQIERHDELKGMHFDRLLNH